MFNEILEGGLNQVVIKRLGMQVGTPVPAVQPELAVDLTLESDRPEWGWFKGEYRYGIARSIAAPAAGNHAGLHLANAANSGVLVVVESINVNGTCRASVQATAIATIGTTGFGQRIDMRQPANGRADWAELVTPTASLPSGTDWVFSNAITTTPFILSPGSYLHIFRDAAATAASIAVTWRERPLLSGELG